MSKGLWYVDPDCMGSLKEDNHADLLTLCLEARNDMFTNPIKDGNTSSRILQFRCRGLRCHMTRFAHLRVINKRSDCIQYLSFSHPTFSRLSRVACRQFRSWTSFASAERIPRKDLGESKQFFILLHRIPWEI